MFRKKIPQPKRKPFIQVIGVVHTKDNLLVKESYSNYYAGRSTVKGKGTSTVVLYTVDGALKTKWFDGKWSLGQVKNWKELECPD